MGFALYRCLSYAPLVAERLLGKLFRRLVGIGLVPNVGCHIRAAHEDAAAVGCIVCDGFLQWCRKRKEAVWHFATSDLCLFLLAEDKVGKFILLHVDDAVLYGGNACRHK